MEQRRLTPESALEGTRAQLPPRGSRGCSFREHSVKKKGQLAWVAWATWAALVTYQVAIKVRGYLMILKGSRLSSSPCPCMISDGGFASSPWLPARGSVGWGLGASMDSIGVLHCMGDGVSYWVVIFLRFPFLDRWFGLSLPHMGLCGVTFAAHVSHRVQFCLSGAFEVLHSGLFGNRLCNWVWI